MSSDKTAPNPTLFQAFIPVVVLMILLAVNVYIFGSASLDGANQISLLLAAAVAAFVALNLGVKWQAIHEKALKSINSAMGSILILLMIGALAGTWLMSGIVPAMIYYGLQIMNPTIFLFAACIISAVVSLATGSSWTTIATIGVALLGIGQALGLPVGLIGGAIISGAYFGDKMSPLSDTTNLAPAMAGTDLFTHIRYMAYTTVPSITITLIIFLIIGFTRETTSSSADVENILAAIKGSFHISGWLFIVPAIVIILIVKKIPPVPSLLAGAILGGVCALIFQPDRTYETGLTTLRESVYSDLSQEEFASWEESTSSALINFAGFMRSMYEEISFATGDENVDELLSSKGMAGMMNTIWLILCAMTFGGMMEAGGLLKRIAKAVISMVHTAGGMVGATVGTCLFFNVTASDQYMAIVVPGRMYADTYRKRGLKPEVLSRSLEDSGTVTSVLVPWNTCGATQASVLGVATILYAPYCFFNIISPLMSMFFGYAGIKIRKIEEEPAKETA
ncbi:Na+/H+ antiporter NhaC [Fulvivirgaceae bacterium BMA10]|uniref:Na+/H+ antiporter NhaC n=1 Tax=Splendidivirga corallicola TaxID=3051826 RepID=A0ABT8KRJ2_9BACT|nr:Na+/H+ antiporter NhaC [Fulvivirgaceae bacterium BMA10]